MTTQQYRTNPTGLQDIERSWVSITVRRNEEAKIDAFSLHKLDISQLELPNDAPVSLLAYSGFEELRVDLGTVGSLQLPKDVPLGSLDTSGLIFRLFVTKPAGYAIIASLEGIRPKEDDGEDRAPLLHIEYKPLGERMWNLMLSGGLRPILQVNDNVELDLRSRIETRDVLIRGLIVPQAFEQALLYLVMNPVIDEDPARWQNVWTQYLQDRGIEVPDLSDISELETLLKWARDTAGRFALETQFVSKAVAKKQESQYAKNS